MGPKPEPKPAPKPAPKRAPKPAPKPAPTPKVEAKVAPTPKAAPAPKPPPKPKSTTPKNRNHGKNRSIQEYWKNHQGINFRLRRLLRPVVTLNLCGENLKPRIERQGQGAES